MRVAHVGSYEPNTADGVTQAILGLARHLPGQGVDVEVWQFAGNVGDPGERRVDHVRVFDLPCYSSRSLNLFRLPSRTLAFLKERARHVDLLHLHSSFRPENLWASSLGVPFIVTPHNGYHLRVLNGRNRFAKWLWTLLWEKSYLNRARTVHALTSVEARRLHAFGVQAPIVSMPNVFDPGPLEAAPTPPHAAAVWAFLGRLDVEVKGLDLLLEGYFRCCAETGDRIPPLHVAGPDFRGGRQRLESLARQLGLEEAVQFVGPRFGPSKWRFLAQAEVFLHLSRYEGLPYAVLEAMAMGRPVMITPETNLGDLVREYRAGWVVEPRSASIAGAMREIMHQPPAALDAMGRRGQALIRDHFNSKAIVRRTAEIYRSTHA